MFNQSKVFCEFPSVEDLQAGIEGPRYRLFVKRLVTDLADMREPLPPMAMIQMIGKLAYQHGLRDAKGFADDVIARRMHDVHHP